MATFEEKAKKAFPSEIRWISTTRDSQTPLTAFSGGLPNSLQKTGGSCTSAFLQAAYSTNKAYTSWANTMEYMNQILEGRGLDQDAQLQLDVNKPMDILPPDLLARLYWAKGTAFIVSWRCISYARISHGKGGLVESNFTLLLDLKGHPYYPTKKNILNSFHRLVTQSNAGDVAFVHFAGKCRLELFVSILLSSRWPAPPGRCGRRGLARAPLGAARAPKVMSPAQKSP